MAHRLHSALRVLATLALVGCEPASATGSIQGTLSTGALVVTGVTDAEQSWTVTMRSDSAPAGTYLLFESAEPPTSLAALSMFDPQTCTGSCDLPGLGRYDGAAKLDATGPLSMFFEGSFEESETSKQRYFVLARTGASPTLPFAVEATVTIEGAGGCGGPNPPALHTESLADP